MAVQMNIVEAKAKLSELIARAMAGEDVVISRDGKPAVRLAPVASGHRLPRLGALAHLGPLENPYGLLEPDADIADVLDDPVWPKVSQDQ
jgi:prevent-host-death family protein